MKSKLFIIILFFSGIKGYTQVRIGLQFGLNLANAKVSSSDPYFFNSTFESSINPGIVAGLTSDINVGASFHFRPEINFMRRGVRLVQTYIDSATAPLFKYAPDYLSLPLHLTYNFKLGVGKLFLGAGPELAFGLGGKVKKYANGRTGKTSIKFDNKNENDDYVHFEPLDVLISSCVGYELNNGLFLSLGYSYGVKNITTDKYSVWKNKGFVAKVGFNFYGNSLLKKRK